MGYFIDIQGTLIDDVNKAAITGAIDFIDTLNSAKIPYVLVTNNSKTDSDQFFNYLKSVGFNCNYENYIDPLMVLQELLPAQPVAAYGDEKFLQLLVHKGYELEYENPSAVLVGMKKDFAATEYAQMIRLLQGGAKLVGMHASTVYAKDGLSYPGLGAILQMLSYATNCSYDVVGKPSELFYEKALKKIGYEDFGDVMMISDDLVGDLVGAKEIGCKTSLVLSGKIKDPTQLLQGLKESQKPDRIEKNIGKLIDDIR